MRKCKEARAHHDIKKHKYISKMFGNVDDDVAQAKRGDRKKCQMTQLPTQSQAQKHIHT